MKENKYLLIVDDFFLKDFERIDGLNFYVTDKNGTRRTLVLKPLVKPVLVTVEGNSVYLEPGYIDAMIEYEREQHIKEICERMNHSLDGINDVDLPKRIPLMTPEELKRQFGIVSPSEHAKKQYAVNPEELKKAVNGEIKGDN